KARRPPVAIGPGRGAGRHHHSTAPPTTAPTTDGSAATIVSQRTTAAATPIAPSPATPTPAAIGRHQRSTPRPAPTASPTTTAAATTPTTARRTISVSPRRWCPRGDCGQLVESRRWYGSKKGRAADAARPGTDWSEAGAVLVAVPVAVAVTVADRLRLLGLLHHQRLGGEHHPGDGDRVRDRVAGHLHRVEDALLGQLPVLTGRGVEAVAPLAA